MIMNFAGQQERTPQGFRLVDVTQVLTQVAWWALIAIGLCAAVAAIVAVVRKHNAARALEERDEFALLPTTSFDPNSEEILRYAIQLARTRPASAWFTPRTALGIRIRMGNDAEGLLTYRVSGPRSCASVLEASVYGEVETHRVPVHGSDDLPIEGGSDDLGK